MADDNSDAITKTEKMENPILNGVKENGDATPDLTDITKWEFPTEERYKLALSFYKDKEGKALQLSYQDKLKLVALTKQASLGKYRADASPSVGLLDVVGNDRRQAWQSLGEMPQEEAMSKFIELLSSLCPPFQAYIEAHKAKRIEQERKRIEEEERLAQEAAARKAEEETKQKQEEQRQKQLQQEMQIRAALNQQTEVQFRQYVEQQCPGQPEQQQVLMQQLQEQHFQQYMQQIYQQQLLHQQQQQKMLSTSQNSKQASETGEYSNSLAPVDAETIASSGTLGPANDQDSDRASLLKNPNVTNEHLENDLPPIAAASMWTRKDIKEFKDLIGKDPESVIKVGSGETVTVRVPTHEDGTCLFWEFATDSYDLGFGVYFEWSISNSNQVSVHVSESSDEEDLEEEDGFNENKVDDIEKGPGKGGASKKDDRPPTDEIIPVYRRDCHEEVYCGSHMYPGQGVYLLKFDNSYSLWRSKTLYYRVYYTR